MAEGREHQKNLQEPLEEAQGRRVVQVRPDWTDVDSVDIRPANSILTQPTQGGMILSFGFAALPSVLATNPETQEESEKLLTEAGVRVRQIVRVHLASPHAHDLLKLVRNAVEQYGLPAPDEG